MADPVAAALAAGRIAPHEAYFARHLMAAELAQDGGEPEDTWVAAKLAELPRGRAVATAGQAEYDDLFAPGSQVRASADDAEQAYRELFAPDGAVRASAEDDDPEYSDLYSTN